MTLHPALNDDGKAFADTIRRAFRGAATEIPCGPDGIVWKWSHRGFWTVTAGAVLHPEPVIAGPAGEWRIARMDHAGAVFALLILSAADALPDVVDVPAPAPTPGPAGALYGAGGVRVPEQVVRPAVPADPAGSRPSPSPRPVYRKPGANTGARPGSSWFAAAQSMGGDGPPVRIAGSELWPAEDPTPAAPDPSGD